MAAALPGSAVLIGPEDTPEQPLPHLPGPLSPLTDETLHPASVISPTSHAAGYTRLNTRQRRPAVASPRTGLHTL